MLITVSGPGGYWCGQEPGPGGGAEVGFAEAFIDGGGEPGGDGRQSDEETGGEGVMPAEEFACEEDCERGEERQHVGGEFVTGDAQEKVAPEDGVEVGLLLVFDFGEAEESGGPGHSKTDEDRDVEPEGLDVLEFWREEALDVVADDEFVDEALAVDGVAGEVPGECGG